MAKALRGIGVRDKETLKAVDWNKRMSNHIAAALLVYTALHILVTMQAVKGEGGSILPYFGLVVLVAAIIPACRLLEKRWEKLTASGAGDPRLRPAFKRDRLSLWVAAVGLPFIVSGAVTAFSELTG